MKTIEERKAELKLFFTSLYYNAVDYGEVRILEGMENDLNKTNDINKFIKLNRLEKPFKEFMAEN